jgi:PAS domain-containing protein
MAEPKVNAHADTPGTERRRVRGRRLTDRQNLVLELVAEGLENKEIAHQMGLTEQAIKEHVSALLHRLAVRNRAALAEVATELKIAGTMQLRPEWLGYIYQQSPVASAVVRGPDHVYVSANDAYRRAAGVEELVGLRMIDVFPRANPRAMALLAEVLATAEPKVAHEMPGHWIRNGKMGEGYVDVIFQPLPGADGAISISGVDVTDQVRARQSLAELSAEQLALLDLVPNGIVVVDRGGAVVKVNRAAQTLLGDGPLPNVNSEGTKSYRPRDAITGRDLAAEQVLARAFAGEAIRDLRIRIFLPARGRDASMRIDAEPLRTADGTVRAIVAAITEVVEHPLQT